VGAIAQGEPEVAAVARALATSDRSLQRRLQEEGTSFRGVVDDARRELAVGYLGDRRMTVAEVAYLLGYSEASAFVRAFKRWTGKTPGEMRTVAAM
jgi:AraC-like DNA-binding protein